RPLLATLAGVALIAVPIVLPLRDTSRPADPDLAAIADGGLRVIGDLWLPAHYTLADRIYDPKGTTLGGRMSLPQALPVNVSAMADFSQGRVAAPGVVLPATGGAIVDEWAQVMTAAQAAADGEAPPDAVYGPLGITRDGAQGIFLWLPRTEGEQLDGRVVDVDASVRMRFTRHTLVGDLPLRAGVAFRTADYVLEVQSIDRTARTAICRFFRFPTLDGQAGPALRFFDGASRGRVLPATLIDHAETEFFGGPGTRWARGRTWATRMDFRLVDIVDGAAPQAAPRLLIVQSRAAGAHTTVLTGRGVSIRREPDRP
ncbi:MAG: hypothetical protein ABIT71_07975, partial [Vicinamibacteraceae bacterium]